VSQQDGARRRPSRQRKQFRKFLSNSLTGFGTWLIGQISASLRIHTVDEHHFFDTEGGKILCMWHSRAIPPTKRMRGVDLSVLISLSRDGEVINSALSNMGYASVRGSSGPSGARVLASCIKMLRAGKTLVVTPDGPRGPSGVLQGGVITMAQKSGCALVPTGCASKPRIVMKSWDRFEMPLPFAKAYMLFGEPMYVPQDADADEMERIRLALQTEMRRLQDEADRKLGQPTWAEIVAKG
jgi:lysophospholipid acyltransferase (LPLAT)-like uncharacterized protein